MRCIIELDLQAGSKHAMFRQKCKRSHAMAMSRSVIQGGFLKPEPRGGVAGRGWSVGMLLLRLHEEGRALASTCPPGSPFAPPPLRPPQPALASIQIFSLGLGSVPSSHHPGKHLSNGRPAPSTPPFASRPSPPTPKHIHSCLGVRSTDTGVRNKCK